MYYDVFKLDIWGRYVQLKRLLLYIRLTFGILNYCSALLNTLPQNKVENKALAPDECPDPQLDFIILLCCKTFPQKLVIKKYKAIHCIPSIQTTLGN